MLPEQCSAWARGTTSLLDTTPLRRTAAYELPTGQLAANVADGVQAAVGMVATRMPAESASSVVGAASGRSVLFLAENSAGDYTGDPDRALDVVRGPLDPGHVLASSAIPVAFPPIQITEPDEAAGWYVDGGVRLNTPLHPAVGLGATRILLVSATSTTYSQRAPPDLTSRTPDVADAAAQVLHAALADRTTEDLDALRRKRAVSRMGALIPAVMSQLRGAAPHGRAFTRSIRWSSFLSMRSRRAPIASKRSGIRGRMRRASPTVSSRESSAGVMS